MSQFSELPGDLIIEIMTKLKYTSLGVCLINKNTIFIYRSNERCILKQIIHSYQLFYTDNPKSNIRYLIKQKGIKYDWHNLHYTVKSGVLDDVKFVVKNPKYMDSTYNDYFFILKHAASDGHLDITDFLIGIEDIKPATLQSSINHALPEAAFRGHVSTVKLLLDRGADIHYNEDQALRDAVAKGRTNVVKLLLERGADIHSRNDYAIKRAIEKGQTGAVKLLIEHGIDITMNDNYLFQQAVHNGNLAVIKLLIQAGAKDSNGTALRWSTEYRPQIAKYLISIGMNHLD